MNNLTPMLKQYMGIKAEYPDAILFFRMGDFYEMFFDDALTASRILGITLTSRGKLNGEKVPMCGIPYHSVGNYIGKLVDNGLKIAICEQVEDPKSTKGIVKREVIRLVTPGSVVDETDIDEKTNRYIAAICQNQTYNLQEKGPVFGLAHADLTTGQFFVTELSSVSDLIDEIAKIDPAEILALKNVTITDIKELSQYHTETIEDTPSLKDAESILKEHFGTEHISGPEYSEMTNGIIAAGMLVRYIKNTQKASPHHIDKITSYRVGDFMILDETTCSHLELLRTMRRQSRKGSLFQVIDKTMTPMGGRILKRWIIYPLINAEQIRSRLKAVATMKDDPVTRKKIRDYLKDIYDMERLNGRIALGRATPRDLLSLKASIQKLPLIKEVLKDSASEFITDLIERMDLLHDVALTVENAIHDDPPVSFKDGGIIKEGYNEELDNLISLSRNGKTWITEFAASEQERTGISSLKVGFNRIYGYYIEVSKANIHLVPSDYIRKQTLVNAERYVTEALKNMEETLLTAEEKRISLEIELFEDIRQGLISESKRIKDTAETVGIIDVISGLAETAETNNYVCPHIDNTSRLDIVEARHPVIEQTIKEEAFVPNDIFMDDRKQQVLIITGPNMAGKSTILRQTALIVLMAQIGSFVPARKASIGIADRIFTRVGAMDDLTRGQSTFMVEMNETANILRNATPNSLAILDEIGRGTSTYDGLSLAWAIAEALHDLEGKGVRTLFATHYHELTELAITKPRVKNFNVAIREWNNRIIFLRKLAPGATSKSYGIEVARIAGLPEPVIKRAKEVLETLEGAAMNKSTGLHTDISKAENRDNNPTQMSLFDGKDLFLRDWIKGIDINSITPLEALTEISRIKEYITDSHS